MQLVSANRELYEPAKAANNVLVSSENREPQINMNTMFITINNCSAKYKQTRDISDVAKWAPEGQRTVAKHLIYRPISRCEFQAIDYRQYTY